MRIGAPQQIAIFLKDERCVEFGGSSDDEFRSRSHSVQQCTRANCRQRLPCATVSTKHIVSSNASAAKTAIDCLYLNRLIAECGRRHSVTDPPRHQLLE